MRLKLILAATAAFSLVQSCFAGGADSSAFLPSCERSEVLLPFLSESEELGEL